MATITEVRDALAEHLRVGLGMDYASGRVPSPIQPMTVFIIPRPGTDYVAFEAGTFCQAPLAVSAIIVGPTTNLDQAAAWLDAAIEKAPHVMATNPKLAGRTSTIVLEAVSEPGTITAEGGKFLSAELRFKPFFVKT